MSDELDPELAHLFAGTNRSLPGADFHARVIASLHQPHGWHGLARAVISGSRAALAGVTIGIVAPFRLRFGHIGLMAISGAAAVVWITLQGG